MPSLKLQDQVLWFKYSVSFYLPAALFLKGNKIISSGIKAIGFSIGAESFIDLIHLGNHTQEIQVLLIFVDMELDSLW